MSTYAFRAVDVAGVPSRGEVDAESKSQVSEQLRERGLIVLDVSEKNEAFRFEKLFDRFRGIKMRELVGVRAGSSQRSSRRACRCCARSTRSRTRPRTSASRARSAEVRQDVEAGSSLADAMERRPQVFDPLFRAMVRSGESSGRLEEALDRVAVPAGEDGRAATADPVRAPLPGVRLHGRDRDHAGRGRSSSCRCSPRSSRTSSRTSPASPRSCPLMTRITEGVSNGVTGYWYIWIPVVIGLVRRLHPVEEDREGAGAVGPGEAPPAVPHRRRGQKGRRRALVAHLLGVRLRRRPDPAVDQAGRQDLGKRPGREGDGRCLRVGQGGRDDRPPGRASPTSSRRWSATWSRWGRRAASSSRC